MGINTPGRRASLADTPPYAAYASFEALLQRAAKEPVPPRVDRGLLQDWGIAAKNESAMLTSLRTLGLVDEEDAPTEDFKELRLSPPRHVAALRRALERAYPGLVSAGGNPPTDPHRLRDYFVAERGLSGQMVDKATRFYRHLADAASVAVPAAEPPRSAPPVVEPRPSASEPRLSVPTSTEQRARHARRRRAQSEGGSAVQLTIHVDIPFEASDEELRRFFQRVRRAWREGG